MNDIERDVRAIAVRRQQSEMAIDDALSGSFPASDPPAWNPGMARPIPVGPSPEHANDSAAPVSCGTFLRSADEPMEGSDPARS